MFGWGKKDCKTPPVGPEKPVNSVPTVKFDPTRVTGAVLADLKQNIRAVPEVGVNDFETVYQAASRASSVGGALNIIYAALGMFFNDEWTWPWRNDGCKCVSKSMIAGIDGYDGGKPKGLVE